MSQPEVVLRTYAEACPIDTGVCVKPHIESSDELRSQRNRGPSARPQRSSEQLADLLLSLPDAVLVQQEGTVVFANPYCAKLFRADSEDQLLGRRMEDAIHPDDLALVKTRVAEQ